MYSSKVNHEGKINDFNYILYWGNPMAFQDPVYEQKNRSSRD